jgi:hypothetical protein
MRNLGLSGIKKMTTIAMAPLMQAESSSHNHSFEIYQKYKHPKTLTREVKT